MVQLRFREVDRDLFEDVRNGRKRYELRANTERFRGMGDGDSVTVRCGDEAATMQVRRVRRFRDLREVFAETPVAELMPGVTEPDEAVRRINGFPGYAEKIRTHGVVVMELDRP